MQEEVLSHAAFGNICAMQLNELNTPRQNVAIRYQFVRIAHELVPQLQKVFLLL